MGQQFLARLCIHIIVKMNNITFTADVVSHFVKEFDEKDAEHSDEVEIYSDSAIT